MELHYTPEEEAFRAEVRDFIRTNLPADIAGRVAEGRTPTKEDFVTWTRILNRRGWAVPHWPKELGGTGWSPIQTLIFQDETQQACAPPLLPFGVSMVGPVIYTFGSEAQKRRFLPAIANLDEWWCQGFSEPGAGSDLAALSTTARLDGDHWVINGQKTWTTLAQHADWIFVLARTDPQARKRQEGISFFLVDMRSPGITHRPIELIDGEAEVNDVFFDDVRVPVENLVGEVNKGWSYAKFLLGNERNGIANVGASRARLARIRRLAGQPGPDGRVALHDPLFLARLVKLEISLKALEITELRIVMAAHDLPKGQPDPLSSVLKLKGADIHQAGTELLFDLAGAYGIPFAPYDEYASNWTSGFDGPEWAGSAAPVYFNNRKVSIYGGSTEVQNSILAKAVLGL